MRLSWKVFHETFEGSYDLWHIVEKLLFTLRRHSDCRVPARVMTAPLGHGVDHIQATVQAKDYTNGAGCAGNGGFTPTDVGIGLPSPGNANFKVGLFSGTGGDKAALLIGLTNPNAPLAGIGMPGCFLRSSISISVGVTLSGTGNGNGTAIINLPIPAGVSGTVYRQWAEVNTTPVNALGIIMSNGRQMIIQ